MEDNKGQILLYQTADGESRIEVRLEGETVWLSLDQMAELFQRNKSTISRHIKNVFEEGELDKDVVVAKFATTTQHGAIEGKTQSHMVDFYNLDMIISVGYRAHCRRKRMRRLPRTICHRRRYQRSTASSAFISTLQNCRQRSIVRCT